MPEAPSSVRALSFGGIVENYDRYRPPPPAAAATWVLAEGARDVVELGAGTGALTRRLLEAVPGTVVAIEPDERMRAVLHARTPRALVVGSFAENVPLLGHRFDAVLASSAWHWMEPEATFSEVARILRPGGRLGVLGNGPDRRVEWVAELLEDWNAPDAAPRPPRPVPELPAGAPFGAVETTRIEWSLPMTRGDIVGLAGTYSRVLTQPVAEQAEHLARLEAQLAEHRLFQESQRVELPMICRCWRVTRD